MSKIALITDTHGGVRNDSQHFLDHSARFYKDVLFPVLREREIKHLIHLGDLFDRRKYTNTVTAKRVREDFLEPMSKYLEEAVVIAGNHDTTYKTTNDVSSLQELVVDRYPNIRVALEPQEVTIGDFTFLAMPWICSANREQSFKALADSKSTVCLGHLELAGFQMYRGQINEHGQDAGVFQKFDLVCSGHYHHKSSTGNIHYLGSHAQFTWAGYGDDRGFHILDTETLELEFIRNPYTMFKKIWYDDRNRTLDAILAHDFEQYKASVVRVIVQSRENPYHFDKFIDTLEKVEPVGIQVVEDHLNAVFDDGQSEVTETVEDTLTMLRNYVETLQLGEDVDRSRLERLMTELYTEALTMDTR